MGDAKPDRAALTESVVERHLDLLRAMQAEVTDDWLQMELTLAQIKALFALWGEPAATIGALGERLGIGVPAASHLVERLVQLGMVERREDEADRRRAFVYPTERGTALVDRLRALRQGQTRRWLTRLDDAELALVERAFALLVRAAGAVAPGR